MEPVLTAGHYRQSGVVMLRKFCDGCKACQLVLFAVKNLGGGAPCERLHSHIAEVFPRKRFPEIRLYLSLLCKLMLADPSPFQHIQNELLHVRNGRNEKCFADPLLRQGVHRKKRTNAVGNEYHFIAVCTQMVKEILNGMKAANDVFNADINMKPLLDGYAFYKTKRVFEEQALDHFAQKAYAYEVDKFIKAHPEFKPEEIQEVYASNRYEDFKNTPQGQAQRKEIRDSKIFKDFMDTIKTPKDITAMNDLAANGKLYGYINGQKFQKVDVEAQYTAAQNRIKQASHDKEALRNDYAIMLTVSALKTTKIHVADMTVVDFEKYTEKMYEKNGFQEMMDTRTSEALYNFATTGNGLGLAMEEQKASAEYHKREDGKKKSQEQQKNMNNQKDKSMNP